MFSWKCYKDDYLNHHSKSSECKAKAGQRIIYNFYKPIQVENAKSLKKNLIRCI
ncbi:hypothetical protein C1645_836874 [Glomus cerebriforme]|uniref:Uncharacterized protein n=1 Tax=Glomus cerebriforme TaxID=658196 RepID=A0A397SGE6_9GLOM|nr:hypothetical protein C1645_836874 [Glomus cerebriforme]